MKIGLDKNSLLLPPSISDVVELPPAGHFKFFSLADGSLYRVDSAGTAVAVLPAGVDGTGGASGELWTADGLGSADWVAGAPDPNNTIIVSPDGDGDFTTVKAAIDSLDGTLSTGDEVHINVYKNVYDAQGVTVNYTASNITTYIHLIAGAHWEIGVGDFVVSSGQYAHVYGDVTWQALGSPSLNNYAYSGLSIYQDVTIESSAKLLIYACQVGAEFKASTLWLGNGVLEMRNCTGQNDGATSITIDPVYLEMENCDFWEASNWILDLDGVVQTQRIHLVRTNGLTVTHPTGITLNDTRTVGNNFQTLTNVTVNTGTMNALNGILI